jgi:hypothetical protein
MLAALTLWLGLGLAASDGTYDLATWGQVPGMERTRDLSVLYKDIERDFLAQATPRELREGKAPLILLPPGDFDITQTIELCREVSIRGSGGRGWGARTRLNVKRGTTAFRALGNEDCVAQGRGRGAGWAELTDLAILELGASTATTARYGIHSNARLFVERVWIRGFTVGVVISAGAARIEGQGNANSFGLHEVLIEQAEHAGIYVDGPDTNGGTAFAIRVTSNCRRASRWNKTVAPFRALAARADERLFGLCAGVIDSSFLGVEWFSIVAHNHIERHEDGTKTPYPFVRFEGANQRSACYGCYMEAGQLPGQLAPYTVAISGHAQWDTKGGGLRLSGPYANALIFRNIKDRTNATTVVLGDRASVGTFVEFYGDAIDPKRPLRLKVEKTKALRSYKFDIANQLSPLRMTQSAKTWVREFYVGAPGLEALIASDEPEPEP